MDLTVPVTVQEVTVGTMEATVEATGTLRAVRETELLTEVDGTLRWPAADEVPFQGMQIKKGQLIARVENEEHVLNARLETRKLVLTTAQRTLKEQEVLFKRSLVAEKDVEEARRVLSEAESNLQAARIQIAKTELRSPIDGSGLTDLTAGAYVQPRTLIGRVMDYGEVLVDLKVPNTHIGTVVLRQPVRVENYAFPDRTFPGRITSVEPALDPVTRTFRVVGTVENADLVLRPGMFVRAEIVTQARPNTVLVPRRFVLTRQNEKVVFVEEEGRAQMRNVQTGLEDADHVEILEGLEPGDRLITSNYETLRSRTRVRVTGEGTTVLP
ncbi:MAG: efflux RND transporter periplasmic adaptor subunit [bacterium]|nr:efflux RND transporter periplasmic adaptor subunit [bacterium]